MLSPKAMPKKAVKNDDVADHDSDPEVQDNWSDQDSVATKSSGLVTWILVALLCLATTAALWGWCRTMTPQKQALSLPQAQSRGRAGEETMEVMEPPAPAPLADETEAERMLTRLETFRNSPLHQCALESSDKGKFPDRKAAPVEKDVIAMWLRALTKVEKIDDFVSKQNSYKLCEMPLEGQFLPTDDDIIRDAIQNGGETTTIQFVVAPPETGGGRSSYVSLNGDRELFEIKFLAHVTLRCGYKRKLTRVFKLNRDDYESPPYIMMPGDFARFHACCNAFGVNDIKNIMQHLFYDIGDVLDQLS